MRPRTSLPLHTTEDGKPKRKVKKAVELRRSRLERVKISQVLLLLEPRYRMMWVARQDMVLKQVRD